MGTGCENACLRESPKTEMSFKSISLQNGDRVAIVGGGPAGSVFAIHLLRQAKLLEKHIDVVIVEKRVSRPVRRKVFISYFRGDRAEVEGLVRYWSGNQSVFIPQIVGAYRRSRRAAMQVALGKTVFQSLKAL